MARREGVIFVLEVLNKTGISERQYGFPEEEKNINMLNGEGSKREVFMIEEKTQGYPLPLGVAVFDGRVNFSVAASGKECQLLL